jgi:uncharacterized protein involved in exopolysaccharide biosynthesis
VGFTGASVLTLARAAAHRISGKGGADAAQVQALREEVERLRGELDGVHDRLAQMDELQGRMDFAERMLAQVRERGALPGGKP